MRLTEELPMGSYRAKTIYLEPGRNEQECVYKLGNLEDILEKHNIETSKELDGLLCYVKEIKKIEKELGADLITLFKAFKIIKEKRVDVSFLSICIVVEQYNNYIKEKGVLSLYRQLTQEEFDLLKEVLK